MGETVQHLGGRLDRLAVGDRAVAKSVAKGSPGDVFVRDVDVALVSSEVIGANAALVAETCGSFGLARGTRCTLSFPRDDLQSDVEAGAFVTRQPDRPGAAAAERAEWPVPIEDELSLLKDARRRRHDPLSFGGAREGPPPDETVVGRFP